MPINHDHVQVLNYCAHAIEDLRELEKVFRYQMPATAQVYRYLIGMLQDSVKFIMPNRCNLIDPDDVRQAHLDQTRLPYPCVAFEAPWSQENFQEMLGEYRQTPATKRIALCWDASSGYEPAPGLNGILTAFPEGGTFVLPIYWGPEYRQWTVGLGGTFVPYENTVQNLELDGAMPASRIAHAAKLDAGLASAKAKEFRAEPFYILPELYEQTLRMHGGRTDKVFGQILLDSHDETQMLIQACSVLNCANITTSEVSTSKILNQKRKKKGKQPFFTYKVLQVSDERKQSGKPGTGGSHASPRMHLRRGHLRRLESKTIWVRPTMVKAGSTAGVVAKDYAVTVSETEKD